MKKTQHTPGPWEMEKLYVGDYRITSIVEPPPTPIAKIGGWLPEYSSEEKANAKLISAAPDMLDALQKVLCLDLEAIDPANGRHLTKLCRNAVNKAV